MDGQPTLSVGVPAISRCGSKPIFPGPSHETRAPTWRTWLGAGRVARRSHFQAAGRPDAASHRPGTQQAGAGVTGRHAHACLTTWAPDPWPPQLLCDSNPGRRGDAPAPSDLNAGLIDDREARKRRETIRRHADLYGAIGGAIRFTQHDALAALLITGVITIKRGTGSSVPWVPRRRRRENTVVDPTTTLSTNCSRRFAASRRGPDSEDAVPRRRAARAPVTAVRVRRGPHDCVRALAGVADARIDRQGGIG